jgi:hypothetical protein
MMKSNSDPMDLSKPIVDSHMTLEEALEGVDPTCPDAIAARLELVDVYYYSFDDRLHQGQLLIDHDLKKDIEYVFRVILDKRFPIGSVIPISHRRFRKNGQWSDSLSMQANNSSGFNYRKIADSQSLSLHALGRAIDINPRQNPHINGSVLQPLGATYVLTAAGTLSLDNPIVQAFLDRGWTWGGSWHSEKDFQHFSKGTGPDAR